MEQVRHDHEVAVCCQLIRNQLGIDESMSDDIGE
jgi:hypothetical protein